MKRAVFEELTKKNNIHKRLCFSYFEKFKDAHAHEWSYEKDIDAFVDKETDDVMAFRKDGLLYYSCPYGDCDELECRHTERVDVACLDTPELTKDVWSIILPFVSSMELLDVQWVCVLFAKLTSVIFKRRGQFFLQNYGTVFKQILHKQRMSFYDFFDMCESGCWREDWLPFETLFRLPPKSILE